LIASLAAERDGAPWPSTSHRLRAEAPPTSPTSHRLLPAHTDDLPAGRRRPVVRRPAPVLIGALVLAVVAVVGSLRPTTPLPTAAALVAAPTAASPAPSSSISPYPPVASAIIAPEPTIATAPTTTTARSATTRTAPVAARPQTATCTVKANGAQVPAVRPGDTVCFTGQISSSNSELEIKTGGTPDRPVTYSATGTVTVRGIDVEASNVIVQGFTSVHGNSMGAKLLGNNIVFQDNNVSSPVYTGDDSDGIRFFGNGIKILDNTISDVKDGSNCTNQGCGDGPHPDCFQTFYSENYPTSSNILISGNRCQDVADQCLMAEGPVLPGEGVNGPGESANWVFSDNYCDDGANQAMMIKDIKNLSIVDNDFDGTNNKAIALADGSTGAHVGANELNPRIPELISFDDDNESPGYTGPAPDTSSSDSHS
jgi:hypothetical protein